MDRRNWALLLVLLAIRLVIFPIATQWAEAALSPCAHGGPYYDGKIYNGVAASPSFPVRGVQASIQTRHAGLCSTDVFGSGIFSYSWVMMAPAYTAHPSWAQAGFEDKNTGCGCLRFRWEWVLNYGNTAWHKGEYGNPALGTYYKYTSARDKNDGHIHLKVDDVDVPENSENPPVSGVTDFDPNDAWPNGWGGSIEGQWFGEVNYKESDFTGTSSAKTNYSDVLQKDDAVPGNWVSHPYSDLGWLKCDHVSCPRNIVKACWAQQDDGNGETTFKIWTDPADHNC